MTNKSGSASSPFSSSLSSNAPIAPPIPALAKTRSTWPYVFLACLKTSKSSFQTTTLHLRKSTLLILFSVGLPTSTEADLTSQVVSRSVVPQIRSDHRTQQSLPAREVAEQLLCQFHSRRLSFFSARLLAGLGNRIPVTMATLPPTSPILLFSTTTSVMMSVRI
jgi:hypothetical protein